jgi:hypothetical protein
LRFGHKNPDSHKSFLIRFIMIICSKCSHCVFIFKFWMQSKDINTRFPNKSVIIFNLFSFII